MGYFKQHNCNDAQNITVLNTGQFYGDSSRHFQYRKGNMKLFYTENINTHFKFWGAQSMPPPSMSFNIGDTVNMW